MKTEDIDADKYPDGFRLSCSDNTPESKKSDIEKEKCNDEETSTKEDSDDDCCMVIEVTDDSGTSSKKRGREVDLEPANKRTAL